MGEAAVWLSSAFKITHCCRDGCGVAIAIPSNIFDDRLNDKRSFYCINGHGQHFTGQTEEEKLRQQLAKEQQRREWAESDAKNARKRADTARKAQAIAAGKLKAQTNRIKNGVCPCCHRSFQNLHRHMQTKHPKFGTPETAPT